MQDKVRFGFNTTIPVTSFFVPDEYIITRDIIYHQEGSKENLVRITAVRWFTNLPHPKQVRPFLHLHVPYVPSYHRHFDYFDAINVDWISDIPYDYDGYMGVPITFFEHFNPDQFEVIDLCKNRLTLDYFGINAYLNHHRQDCNRAEGRHLYARVIIRKKPIDSNLEMRYK